MKGQLCKYRLETCESARLFPWRAHTKCGWLLPADGPLFSLVRDRLQAGAGRVMTTHIGEPWTFVAKGVMSMA